MAYFPFMVDIKDMQCLVVGGGRIALHKVKILLGFEVKIKVIAKEICMELRESEGAYLQLEERAFQETDIEKADFVVAATGDKSLNHHISELCRAKDIPINAVDMKEDCSFIFPAMIQEKDLLIAISSGGQSPAGVAYVKKRIREQIPDFYGEMMESLGAYRDYILKHVDSTERRKEIFNRLLEYGNTHAGMIPESLVKQMVNEME